MSIINCEINLILTWSADCVISAGTGARKFATKDTKLHVPVATLSTQDNAKLLHQLKSGLKRTINWNKYQLKVTIERLNQYVNCLIDPGFQGVNRIFVLSFEDNMVKTGHTGCFLPKVEICYDQRKIHIFDQPVKNAVRTYDNI